ncbi:MAG TPA: NAD-dependent epimerase/dehydratase family protein [Thermoplasmata archaeon]|nr:NAD-dependent epimerase/dehydratase family protein [Thermoplasmata archaeon]
MKLRDRRVCITGAAGFIGSHAADVLAGSCDLLLLDNLSSGRKTNLAGALNQGRARFVKQDLLAPKLGPALKGVEVVMHFAANPDVRGGVEDPKPTFHENVVATFRLLDACRKADVKGFVLASTSTVYGEARTVPTPEDYGPLAPMSIYGASKLTCEAILSSFAHTYGIDGITFRFANVVGGRSTHGVVADFVRKLRKTPRRLEIFGREPGTSKSYVYIDDAIRGILAGIDRAVSPVDVFNVGSDDSVTVKEIADTVVRELRLANVAYAWTGGVAGGGWTGDVRRMVLDTTKLRASGWRPEFRSADAIARAARDSSSKFPKL